MTICPADLKSPQFDQGSPEKCKESARVKIYPSMIFPRKFLDINQASDGIAVVSFILPKTY